MHWIFSTPETFLSRNSQLVFWPQICAERQTFWTVALVQILAIDPGKRTGWAAFITQTNAWVLLICGETDGDDPNVLRACDRVIVETPHAGKGRASVSDLIVLARRAGLAAGRSGAREVQYVEPATWKGDVPKPIHHLRIRAVLSSSELHLVDGKGPDVWDAVGLGLWAVKRLGRGGV